MALISRYKLDNDVTDTTGTNNGTATSLTYTTGQFGQAGSFNGSTSRVQIATPAFNFERTDPFSVSVWINPAANGVNNRIVSKLESSGSFKGWELHRASAGSGGGTVNRIQFQLISASGSLVCNSTAAVANSVWTHVVVTYSGNSLPSGVLYYLNGSINATLTATNTLAGSILNTVPTQIGSLQTLGGKYFNGLIDDVRIYNHALTLAEVLALYSGSSGSLLLRRRRAS